MKIAVLSDIHLDMNSKFVGVDLLPFLIESLEEKELDLILIAGDISDHVSTTIKILNELEQTIGVKVLFIPGNHDIWIKTNESSWDSYNNFANHSSTIIDSPYFLNDDTVIIGDMGWYDYTLVADGIDMDRILSFAKDWGDHKYSDWEKNDQYLMDFMLNKIERQLKQFSEKKIIFVTHFVPYMEFTSKSSEYMDWDTYNAFMGSAKLGDLLNQYNNIEYVIFGHTHERFGRVEDFHNKTIICNPLGYISEREIDVFKKELESSIITLHIE